MQSDSYSLTDPSTIENTSNSTSPCTHQLLCYLVLSTSLCTTSFSYLPTDRYFRSNFGPFYLILPHYALLPHSAFSRLTVTSGQPLTIPCTMQSDILPHYALLPHSAFSRLTVTSGQPLTTPCTTSQTHILRSPSTVLLGPFYLIMHFYLIQLYSD